MSLKDGLHDVAPGMLAMVVTHLEMTAPAALRGAVLPDELRFAALARDIDVYRDVFRRVGGDWLWYGRLTLTDAALANIVSDPDVDLFTLERDGQPEALLELDFREAGQCELAYFGLTDALIGTGAGAYLMDQAIWWAWAPERGIERFHVHTCTIDSPQAVGFYQRSGFTAYRRQVEIAPDPRHLGLHPKDAAQQIPLI